MQRIVCRYRKEASSGLLRQGELRQLFLDAASAAGLPLAEGRRAIQMGPALPPEAVSDVERFVLGMAEPREPSEIPCIVNLHLPVGIHIEAAWIAIPGSSDENPADFDEAVYLVTWKNPPPPGDVLMRIQYFLNSAEAQITRQREKKVQQLNARCLVRDLQILAGHGEGLRLRMIVSVGPRGNLRPQEVLQAIGYQPEAASLIVRREALWQSAWRNSPRGRTGIAMSAWL